ncbi:MAG: DUF2723 domain-containing protein [Saprospiraceae bacterium]|nr:DUF2723 domain-containing protein [Saprospiraceae bacterium]
MKKYFNITGIAIFLITFIVFFMSAERVGSLWDCGEFILGAHKLQVVHPPGAPLFLLIGRMFTWVATVFSDTPSDIAFAVNLMSGMSTSLAAMFAGWITMMFGKIGMVGRDGSTDEGQNIALALGGLATGLATAFASSIWFSAVEGEVYAMSTMFTALTYWAAVKWYYLPNDKNSDRWLVLSIFAAGLSIGVHLLSLLTFPAIALLYYYKKYNNTNTAGVIISLVGVIGLFFLLFAPVGGGIGGRLIGLLLIASLYPLKDELKDLSIKQLLEPIAALGLGVFAIGFVQKVIIVWIPTLWMKMDVFMVNSVGMPVHSGLIPTVLILGSLAYLVLRYAHKNGYYMLQLFTVSSILVTVAFSTIGTVVIRANADTPVNMNVPSDATRLLPYLNREQYGERALLRGPHYNAKPEDVEREDRLGLVNGRYEVVDEKFTYVYKNEDKIMFPRMGHTEASRPQLHNMWRGQIMDENVGKPGMDYNLKFMMKYQVSWMYWRYFMWNFVGKQNGEQGYYPWDIRDGHWKSGIGAFDSKKLYNMSEQPDTMKDNKASNSYFFLPLIFGLLGILWHFSRSRREFLSLLIMFLLTGLGIILYSNQPPNEPRERDYIFAGSFMAFSMWIGMGVFALYDIFKDNLKMSGLVPSIVAGALVLSAPIIMGFQNFDDHSRADIQASRDYAANFLNSVEENAILFTYGDNDTYPLWYAQEVEGIRTDVRVVNLSLIAVDWYINKLRNKVNNSDPIKLSIPADAIRGKLRNQVFFFNPNNPQDDVLNNPLPLDRALQFIANPKNVQNGQTILNSKNLVIPINESKYRSSGMLDNIDSIPLERSINIKFPQSKSYITKDDLAVLDIISSNFYDRPIYFATTCKNEKLQGLNDYMQLEGLALRLVPIKTRSDQSLAIYGSGRADLDAIYDNVMNKWSWGNFDKKDLFVDKNYMAEVQAMKMAMLRASALMTQKGDTKRAADLAKKYFEGFPHMNFAYDAGVVPFINVLVRTGEFEDAKKHLRILGEESRQYMKFYESLSPEDFEGFQQDIGFYTRAIEDVLSLSKEVEDPTFAKEMTDLVGPYSVSAIQD